MKRKTIAFIGGSGLAEGLENILDEVREFKNEQNKFGTVISCYIGKSRNADVIILPRHGKEGVRTRMPAELVSEKGYEANIWQLHELGAEEVYGFTAVGSMDLSVPLADNGCFVVPHSYIRGLAASQHSFGENAKNIFPNMSQPFDESLRCRAINAIKQCGYKAIQRGTYIYNCGNQFETPEEIRMLERMTVMDGQLGSRVVGMTTVPEAVLLAQMGIPFAAVCSNVNYAEGISAETGVSHAQTMKVMDTAAKYLTNVARKIVERYNK